jgi:NAD(P)-dependent dehydrogenase (short-subunit alcohol dehydrogenase family)
MKLAGRNAIITGASQGLGLSIATHYVNEGASVLLCARDEDALRAAQKTLLAACPKHDQRVLTCKADVGDLSQIEALVSYGIEELKHIDILVNNAGIYGPFGVVESVALDEWIEAIRVNLFGTVYGCRALVPHLKRQRYGKIICLSGGGATNPLPRISAYAAAKAAVVRFAETLALEVREFGIDVNSIAPGALATRLTDQLLAAGPDAVGPDLYARMEKVQKSGGTPLDMAARLCVYLGSKESDGITGKLLSAVWDPWQQLQSHRADLDSSDVYTLRRIVPKDRGMLWGDI